MSRGEMQLLERHPYRPPVPPILPRELSRSSPITEVYLTTLPSREGKKPSPFNLMDSFIHYEHWRNKSTADQARDHIHHKLALDLRALHHEAVGEKETEPLVTEVVWDGTSARFKNAQYQLGEDLVSMYENSFAILSSSVSNEVKIRYAREVLQTIAIWEKAVEPLKSFQPGTPDILVPQLLAQGFRAQTLPLSLGLFSIFPELKIDNPDLLIQVLTATPFISVSPPSKIHREGKSSFAWVNQLLYIPSINKFAVLQNGYFTAYTQEEIARFLEFRNPDHPSLSSEAGLLAYLNILPPEFTALHAHAILDMVVQEIGYFKALPPIDDKLRPGKVTHEAQLQAVLDIFEWEYQRCQAKPELRTTLAKRFEKWEEAVLHSAVSGFAFDAYEVTTRYKALFQNNHVSIHPERFRKFIESGVLAAYPAFSTALDLRGLDCMAGLLLSIQRDILGNSVIQGLSQHSLQLLKKAEVHGLQNEAEFQQFCKTFGLPPELFKLNTDKVRCPGPGCNQVPYKMGPCVCPVCHAKDNVTHFLSKADLRPTLPQKPETITRQPAPIGLRKVVTLTQLINNDVHQANDLKYAA